MSAFDNMTIEDDPHVDGKRHSVYAVACYLFRPTIYNRRAAEVWAEIARKQILIHAVHAMLVMRQH